MLGAISPQRPLFSRVWQNSLFGFDNNSQAFFHQTIFAWQVFESTFEWQKKYFGWHEQQSNSFDSWQTNLPVGRQKIKISILLDKKTVFIFHVRQIFWQKLLHNLRNYFWRRERWRQFFHLFIFRFHQTIGLFFLWTQIFNSKKNDKSFFTFFTALFGQTEKLFCSFLSFFRRRNET